MEVRIKTFFNAQPVSVFQIHKIDDTRIITTNRDNTLKILELPDFRVVKYIAFTDYIYGINYDAIDKEIYLGDGSGHLQIFNTELEFKRRKHLHNDLLTQILLVDEKVITASADGTMKILDKSTLQPLQVFDFKEPIWNIKLIGDTIYVSRQLNPSLKIQNFKDESSLQLNLKNIIEVSKEGNKNKEIYGNSPSLNKVFNLGTGEIMQVGCHGLVNYNNHIVTLDTQNIILHCGSKQRRMFQFPSSDNPSILDVKEVGEYLVVGLDNGKIMALKINLGHL